MWTASAGTLPCPSPGAARRPAGRRRMRRRCPPPRSSPRPRCGWPAQPAGALRPSHQPDRLAGAVMAHRCEQTIPRAGDASRHAQAAPACLRAQQRLLGCELANPAAELLPAAHEQGRPCQQEPPPEAWRASMVGAPSRAAGIYRSWGPHRSAGVQREPCTTTTATIGRQRTRPPCCPAGRPSSSLRSSCGGTTGRAPCCSRNTRERPPLRRWATLLEAPWRVSGTGLARDALLENKKFVRVDLQDINNFDPQLGRCIMDNPTEYLPVVCLQAFCGAPSAGAGLWGAALTLGAPAAGGCCPAAAAAIPHSGGRRPGPGLQQRAGHAVQQPQVWARVHPQPGGLLALWAAASGGLLCAGLTRGAPQSDSVSQLVMMPGIITNASRPKVRRRRRVRAGAGSSP